LLIIFILMCFLNGATGISQILSFAMIQEQYRDLKFFPA
jgi:hypothetical protein